MRPASKKFLLAASLAFVFSLLSGCISVPKRPQLPESVGNDGLVVAQIQGVGQFGLYGYAEAVIKGGSDAKLAGYQLAHVLPPGQYTLEALRQKSTSGTSSFNGVTVSKVTVTTLPLNVDFTVRAGQVTNLGQLVLVPDERDPERKRFVVYAVDNASDTRHVLQTFYPALYASLGSGAATLAPQSHVQGQDLLRLRRAIALQIGGSRIGGRRFVAGPAGTLALLDRAPDGRITQVRLVDSPVTTAPRLSAEQPSYDRLGFFTNDGRFFMATGSRVEARALPVANPTRVFLFGDSGVVLADEKFNLHTSHDDGRSWRHFAGAVVEDSEYSRHDGLTEAHGGYYLHHHFPPRLVHAKSGGEYERVALPEGATNIRRVVARGPSLFLEKEVTAWTSSTPHPFFVRPSAGQGWETRHKPRASCGLLEFQDDSGQQLRTRCDGTVHVSSDGGVSWR